MTNLGIDFERSSAGIAEPWLSAPFGLYQTSDGWIALAMGDLRAVATVFDAPDLAGHDPWLDRDLIKRRLDELTPSRCSDDWLSALLDAGLWAAPVRTMKAAMEELIEDRSDLVVEVEHHRGGTLTLLGCPITLSETPWQQRLRPPAVGEHTREVLQTVLDDAQLAALEKAGAL